MRVSLCNKPQSTVSIYQYIVPLKFIAAHCNSQQNTFKKVHRPRKLNKIFQPRKCPDGLIPIDLKIENTHHFTLELNKNSFPAGFSPNSTRNNKLTISTAKLLVIRQLKS